MSGKQSASVNRAESLAKLFDSSVKIPGTNKSLGLDGFIALLAIIIAIVLYVSIWLFAVIWRSVIGMQLP
jgi:hypothetical protein